MTRSDSYAALVGIDWSDRQHDFCLQVVGTEAQEQGVIGQTPEAIDAWVRGLAERFAGQRMAVCLEQSQGSLIYVRLK
jgi:hypothetical protein